MKRFCLPGLRYSQRMIWLSFLPSFITSAISGSTKNSPCAIHTNQQDRLSPQAMSFTIDKTRSIKHNITV
jgi:hypothetical protein